jgi:uncharacterized protein (UPF0276 family)
MEIQAKQPPFSQRVAALPVLGLGVSTEFGAHTVPGALDPRALAHDHPTFGAFLEIGVEVAKGLDAPARAWCADNRLTTYHFLDINLDDPEDFDPAWMQGLMQLVAQVRPAWLCGDAGLWHFGPRDRAHMLLLPPILSEDSADAMAAGIGLLRYATGCEVLPENPPGQVFVGPLHMLDFFARLADRADTGILLDLAHLAIFQRLRGYTPFTAFDAFPWERVIELHVAGGRLKDHKGLGWVDDDHGLAVLDDTWALLDEVVARAPNLRAVVFECERNPLEATLAGFERIARAVAPHPLLGPKVLAATTREDR